MRMDSFRSRMTRAVGAAALVMILPLAGPAVAAASVDGGGSGGQTCQGGSIAAGSYERLTIAGTCTVDAGNVTVRGNVTVQPGATLVAAFGGSELRVWRNVLVGRNGSLVLGCEPGAFPCLNDNPTAPTMSSVGKIGGNLVAGGALAVLVHATHIGGNLVQVGGGGGVNCAPQPNLMGSPAYATYEDVTIGGSATIVAWHSCWLGFFRNSVQHGVVFSLNVVADPDGNEVATNTIGGNLVCFGNSPAPQIGDSGGAMNTVGGRAVGQCAGLAG